MIWGWGAEEIKKKNLEALLKGKNLERLLQGKNRFISKFSSGPPPDH